MTGTAEDDPIDAAWVALGTDWERDERHRAFVQLASALDRLPEAARRYRESLAVPAHATRAQGGLDEVLRVAMAKLTPPPREERPVRGMWILPLGALAMVLALTVAAAQALRRPSLASAPVLGAEVLVVALLPWSRILRRR